MESSDISSIVNLMVSQVEEGLSKANDGGGGGMGEQLPTAVRNGLRSQSSALLEDDGLRSQSSALLEDVGVTLVNGGDVSSARDQRSKSNKITPVPTFIIPTFGASVNGHEDLLKEAEQVQTNTQQPTSTPVNLSNVFSDSCEIDMSAADNARQQLEKNAANDQGDVKKASDKKKVVSSTATVQIPIKAATSDVVSLPSPSSPRSSPRISIAIGGVNLNILRRPDSPGSPYSPSSLSQPSPSSPSTSTSESIIGVDDKKEINAIISGEKECPILKKPCMTLTTDEDTQDASVLYQLHCNGSSPVTNCTNTTIDIQPNSLLKQEEHESQSLSDTENNNDVGNLCSTTGSMLHEISTPSSSATVTGQEHSKFRPPHVPTKDAQPCRSLLKRRAVEESGDQSQSSNCPPKKKRSIRFDGVTVFYFPRTQGFTCVPSQGGSTLGMSSKHVFSQQFSLPEWAAEQRRTHKQMLLRMRKQQQNERQLNATPPSVEARDEEVAGSNGGPQSSDDEDDTDEQDMETDSELEAELDGYYFLQPVPTRQRRTMLRCAGVKKIDSGEKDECRDIRSSREFCGCSCKLYCDPDTCSCAQANIKCQVDRVNFPCQGCTQDGCGNANGRVEFNPVRVRTHFIHTLMRLELEKKHANQTNCGLDNIDGPSVFSSPSLSLGRHTPSIPTMSSGHDLTYQQNQCTIVPHWDISGSIGGTSSSSYYKREDNMVSGGGGANMNYGAPIRDVAFTTGMELESCVSMGSYTNFHYNTRPQSQMADINNFASHSQHHHHQTHLEQQQNHPMQFSPSTISEQHNMSSLSSSREDSFDLYSSSFREDSYSENSDEFSNESGTGDQRTFPPPPLPCSVSSTPFNNGHGMSMTIPMVMQHSIDGCLQPVPDQTRYLTSGSGSENFFGLNHLHDPVSDSVPYLGRGVTVLSSEPPHHISPMSLISHPHQTDQRLYHHNIMGGTELLHAAAIHYNSTAPNSIYNPPFTVTNMTNGVVYPADKPEVHQNLHSHPQLGAVTYTEISNDSSKVVLCNNHNNALETNQAASASCQKNGFQALQLMESGGEDGSKEDGLDGGNRDISREDEVLASDNFGEIIKKSMVETVSA